MEGEASLYPQRKTTYPEIGTPELRRQIGKELKSAREFQEMSLEQVMAFTKINVRFLENIEEGKWNFLPPTYVKAFIRAYAASVGLQTEKLSNRLDELFSHVVVAAAVFKPYLSNDPDEREPGVKSSGFIDWIERHRAILFYTLVGIIVVVLIVLYSLRSTDSDNAANEEKGDTVGVVDHKDMGTAPAILDTMASRVGAQGDTSGSEGTVKLMSMEFSFIDTCFVKIEYLDSVYYEKTNWPGNTFSLDTPYPIRLSLGNAPAVRLKIEGQQLPTFPGSRRALVLNLGPGGIIG